jgi:hypothetical protein
MWRHLLLGIMQIKHPYGKKAMSCASIGIHDVTWACIFSLIILTILSIPFPSFPKGSLLQEPW